jgi:predicted RecA/RadA family phage recombinase
MAENILNSGQIVTVPAPAAVTTGQLVVVGVNMFGIAMANAASAASVALYTGGVVDLRKLNGASTSAVAGANAHWDATNSNVTISATSNLKIGVFAAAAANTDTTARLRLNSNF